ncbi:MAG: hypothetical protein ACOC22_01755, partial [bacterium]
LYGDCTGLRSDCLYLSGDCTGLYGNCTGLRGNCSDLRGDIDSCEISEEERKKGIDIKDLIEEK